MKKIIALIKPNGPLIYFVNQIHRHFPIHTVVVEDKYLGKLTLINKLKAKRALGTRIPDKARVPVSIKEKKVADGYFDIFGDDWLDLNPAVRVIYCKNVNDPEVEQLMAREKPDLLLDHGTSIIKNQIIEKVPLALNLHWGLSPYYRGTHCTEWALINWDPRNIGVTIHRLAKKIDGGDVLCQTRVEIEPDDTVGSINMKLTREGTRILIGALKEWEIGSELQFHRQDHSLGYLTLNRQWSRQLRNEVRRIEQNGIIRKMLKTPARREWLPISVLPEVVNR